MIMAMGDLARPDEYTVEDDPWARGVRAAQDYAARETPEPQPNVMGSLLGMGRAGETIGEGAATTGRHMADYFMTPGRVAGGLENRYSPGSEEADYIDRANQAAANQYAIGTGFGMVFDPGLYLARGSIGSGVGGRVVQPSPEALAARPAPPFYSAVESAVTGAKQMQAPGPQWLGTLRNAPGVKPEEIERLGLEPWLGAQTGSVTRQQLADYVAANKVNLGETQVNPPKFNRGNLVMPGGENYRETLLTLPRENPELTAVQNRINEITMMPASEHARLGEKLRNEFDMLRDREFALKQRQPADFTGSHWDEPNVLAHYRANDRDIGGKKTLFLEEVQSDWQQAARRQREEAAASGPPVTGYTLEGNGPWVIRNPSGGFVSDFNNLQKAQDYLTRINQAPNLYEQNSILTGYKGIPDAPFKTTWPELTLKRAIREAAEGGYDQIAWTPGSVQAKRYDLSQHVDSVHYNPETQRLVAKRGDANVIDKNSIKPDELASYVGKDVAEKLMQQEPNVNGLYSLRGSDLSVGGEGMRGFYDKMLPAAANKIGKKYGAQVGQGDLVHEITVPEARRRGIEIRTDRPLEGSTPVHTLPITPQLRETALRKGFPLFTAGAATTMGVLAAQDRYKQ